MPDRSAVSLFSNCGAGDVGFAEAGFEFRVVSEIDRRRLRVAGLNLEHAAGVWGDLRDTWEEVVAQYRASSRECPDLVAACPPCQGMSTARRDRGPDDDIEAGARDGRNLLVLPIAKVADALHPRVVVVENVPPFLTRQVPHPENGDGVSAARLLVSLLDDYAVFPLLTDLADYGVPQRRKRAFLTFIHREEPFLDRLLKEGLAPYPVPTYAPDHGGQPVTLGESLEKLDASALDAGTPESARSDQRLHSVPVWPDRLYRMVQAIPAGSGASAWENAECLDCDDVEAGPDDAVCPECGEPLPRPVVQEGDSWRLVKGYRSSSYRRMDPERPATTVTTANGRIGSSSTIHPYENRVLSAMECAHLQTLPEGFDWGEAPMDMIGVNELRAMIGEAVPPRFTEKHGSVLDACLDADETVELLDASDRRCVQARRTLGVDTSAAA